MSDEQRVVSSGSAYKPVPNKANDIVLSLDPQVMSKAQLATNIEIQPLRESIWVIMHVQ